MGFGAGGDGAAVENLHFADALAGADEVQHLHMAAAIGTEHLQRAAGHHEDAGDAFPLLEDAGAVFKPPRLRQRRQFRRQARRQPREEGHGLEVEGRGLAHAPTVFHGTRRAPSGALRKERREAYFTRSM